MKRPQKLAVMLVPTPPYEICGLGNSIEDFDGVIIGVFKTHGQFPADFQEILS